MLFRSVAQDSLLFLLLQQCGSLSQEDRALVLENSSDLESVYASAAAQGDTTPPDNPEDEVDFHYVCFAQSQKSRRLYELDGDRNGPVDLGISLSSDEDLLSPSALNVVRTFMNRAASGGSLNFNLLALAENKAD